MEIKETLEAIQAVETLAVQLQAAMEDGSIDWRDLPKLVPILKDAKAALEGAKDIPAELKDLDEAEIGTLVGRVMNLIEVVMEIISHQTKA